MVDDVVDEAAEVQLRIFGLQGSSNECPLHRHYYRNAASGNAADVQSNRVHDRFFEQTINGDYSWNTMKRPNRVIPETL